MKILMSKSIEILLIEGKKNIDNIDSIDAVRTLINKLVKIIIADFLYDILNIFFQ